MSKQKSEKTPNELLQKYINVYLGDRPDPQDELEIRFGTKYYNGSVAFPTALPGVEHHAYKHGKYLITLPPAERASNCSIEFKTWYEKNKEYKNNKSKQYFIDNPNYSKEYYKKNRERLLEYHRVLRQSKNETKKEKNKPTHTLEDHFG